MFGRVVLVPSGSPAENRRRHAAKLDEQGFWADSRGLAPLFSEQGDLERPADWRDRRLRLLWA